jgi:long-chain fatty acid transport protein
MGMAGAYVAGASGADALWYNPAGLKGSGRQLRVEGVATSLRASYTRLDDAGNYRPEVKLDAPLLPIPLLGYTESFGKNWSFGLALFAPSSQPYNWPRSVDGKPAPQRYSLISTDKSLIVNFAAGLAWHGVKGLSIGVAPTLVTGRFYTDTVFTACDDFTCLAPEDPDYDVPSTVDLKPFFAFTLGVGATYEVGRVKVGASFHTPYDIKGKAKLGIALPDAPIFDYATVDGHTVKLSVPFPWIARFGVQVMPTDKLRTEVALVLEGWSRQQKIGVDPQNIWLRNIVGVQDFQVGRVDIDRRMNNTWSARLGGEYDLTDSVPLLVRAGFAYENSAFKNQVLTPITLDSNKAITSLGLTWRVSRWIDVDVTYGHVFMQDRKIRNSEIAQPNSIRPASQSTNIIANGNYNMEADYFGLGLTYRPGAAYEEPTKKEAEDDEFAQADEASAASESSDAATAPAWDEKSAGEAWKK